MERGERMVRKMMSVAAIAAAMLVPVAPAAATAPWCIEFGWGSFYFVYCT